MNAKHIMDAKTNVATRMAATNANVPMVILEIMDEPVKVGLETNRHDYFTYLSTLYI